MLHPDLGLSRRETRLRKVCSIHKKAESDPHYTHPGSECGWSRGARATDRGGDMLPNKVANLGDAVSLCQTPQQATAGVSMGGQNSG